MTWGLVAVGLVVAAVIFVRRIKRDGSPNWNPRPPNVRERIVAAVWLFTFLVALIDYHAGWQLFAGYDNLVVLGVFLGGLFLFERLPGVTHT